jgi:predicted site-specific integrase-resolvase
VLVAEDAEAIDDLVRDMVRDMVEVLTSFCARLYPKGRAG